MRHRDWEIQVRESVSQVSLGHRHPFWFPSVAAVTRWDRQPRGPMITEWSLRSAGRPLARGVESVGLGEAFEGWIRALDTTRSGVMFSACG